MTRKFLVPIDLTSNQLLNALAQNLGTDPGGPGTGQFWINTTSHLFKWYDGTTVQPVYPFATANTANTGVLRDGSGNFTAGTGTFTGVTINGTPSAATDGATVAWVQALVQGLVMKGDADLATNGALPAYTYSNGTSGVGATLTMNANGALTVDGTAVTNGMVIGVKDETAGSAKYNGLYTQTQLGDGSHPAILTRATNMDTSAQIQGAYFLTLGGTANTGTGWYVNSTGPYTIGTTAITWGQWNGLTDVIATAPITKSGNTLSLNITARLAVVSNNLDLASGIVTAGTYQSVTVDTYGRVTGGSDLISGNGIAARTSAGNYTARTMTGTAGTITVTNGDGVAGNPTFTISASYVGQTTIVTLGTVTTGTWAGTTIAVANGGTGGTTATSARSGIGAIGVYTALIGDGSTTSFAITQATHGLASTMALHVTLYDASSNAQVEADVSVNNSNGTVTIAFSVAPASNAYRVVIEG